MLTVDARGTRNGQPTRLVGRFTASGSYIYQVVVIGPAGNVADETVETYLSSFKAR